MCSKDRAISALEKDLAALDAKYKTHSQRWERTVDSLNTQMGEVLDRNGELVLKGRAFEENALLKQQLVSAEQKHCDQGNRTSFLRRPFPLVVCACVLVY